MYEKVSPSTNFVEREKKTVKFWTENLVFEKALKAVKAAVTTRSTTAPLQQTANLTSATCLHVL